MGIKFRDHFGGYAKVDKVLIDFINLFKQKHSVRLDPIYTGKMMFGLWDLMKKKIILVKGLLLLLFIPEGSKV